MSKQHTIVATPRQQLVDLNGDTTNFDLTFNAASSDGSDFDVVVVDQATLDSNPPPHSERQVAVRYQRTLFQIKTSIKTISCVSKPTNQLRSK